MDDKNQRRFRSSVAARLAKIPVATLRIWERRYGVVAPPKSDSGQRLYSEDDVCRLSLLKRLVQRGHPIGTIAKLDQSELEHLALGRSEKELAELASGSTPLPLGITLWVIGEALVQRLEADDVDLPGAGVVNVKRFANLEEVTSHRSIEPVDVVLIAATSLYEDVASQILSLGQACQAREIAVTYGFGADQALRMLRLSGVRLYREPDSHIELQYVLKELANVAQSWRPASQEGLWLRASRRFEDWTLFELAGRSSIVSCECPRHLVELIMKLYAFEKYSDECESRSVEHALLHRNLGDVANRALALFESALARITDEEGPLPKQRDHSPSRD
ncbi:MerR family transcriptional regulator [Paraburkholderia sp. J12]|uniref:MerR family transcriptional regulator n=1 Tax=Paraburkholderia sp. J12 TaxID=2805432 RepID=UPI002ABD8CBA|nr:MerR family transcriptional regulator [Paraburkholderia sp. J12]